MPPADLISAASVRVKSALLATSATRYPCANRRARAAPSPAPTPTTTATGELADTSMQRTPPGGVRSHHGGAPAVRGGRGARDAPEHGRYRNLLSQQFTPKALESKRAAVGGIVDETLARVADRAQVDFVEALAAIIPLAVIAEMLGIPREDWQHVFHLSNTLLGAADPEYQQGATLAETAERAQQEFLEYFRRLSNARRREPRDDFITALANAQVDGKPIPEWELLSYYVLLIVAGNETTLNATSGGLLALIENPGELEKLRRDPALVPTAVEEIVRWVSPVVQFCRTAVEDVEVRGTKVRKGEACCIFYPSANRDEDVFPDPFTFRVDRTPNEHYGFGIGVHFCLGANLARLELQEIFKRLVARLGRGGPPGAGGRRHSRLGGGVHRPAGGWRA